MTDTWDDMLEKANKLNNSYDGDSFSCEGSDGERVADIGLRVRALDKGPTYSGSDSTHTAWMILEPDCPHYSVGDADSAVGKGNNHGFCSNLSEYHKSRLDNWTIAHCRKSRILGDYNFSTKQDFHISGACGAGDYPYNQEDYVSEDD